MFFNKQCLLKVSFNKTSVAYLCFWTKSCRHAGFQPFIVVAVRHSIIPKSDQKAFDLDAAVRHTRAP